MAQRFYRIAKISEGEDKIRLYKPCFRTAAERGPVPYRALSRAPARPCKHGFSVLPHGPPNAARVTCFRTRAQLNE